MHCPEPVSADERAQLFSTFEHHHRVLLAVSGGRDSLALLALGCAWIEDRRSAGKQTPELLAVTVDHGLRPEAREEGEHVANVCQSLNVEHRVIPIDAPAPQSGVQAWARSVRYRALADLARTLECTAIATGHQAEDQAQTLLMRLARGSGVDGLGAMRLSSRRDDLELLRPLLPIPRSRLTASLKAMQLTWCDDPSNRNPKFERSRFCEHAGVLDALGLSNASINRSARRMQDAHDALAWATEQALKGMPQCQEALSAGYAVLEDRTFHDLPEDLQRRVLIRLIHAVSGEPTPPRLERVETLAALLGKPAAACSTTKHTLGGCIFERRDTTTMIFREPGRHGFPALSLTAGDSAVWDRRFLVRAPATAKAPVEVRAFSDPPDNCQPDCLNDARQVARAATDCYPPSNGAWAALPAFWHDGQLLAVPHLAFCRAPYAISGPVSECDTFELFDRRRLPDGTFLAVSTAKLQGLDRHNAFA